MPKILGIDYGSSKIGLALADIDTPLALPWQVLVNNHETFAKLQKIIETEEIIKIIVGLPLNMKGESTAQTEEVRRFIKQLSEKFELEVIEEDERLSTVQAKKQGKDDEVAAMHILQTFLDRRHG